MEINDAARWHANLASALVGVWNSDPAQHKVLHDYLGDWRTNVATTQDEFLAGATRCLTQNGASIAFLQAVTTAATVDACEELDNAFDRLVDLVKGQYHALASWDAGDDVTLVKETRRDHLFPDPAPFCALGATACVPPEPGGTGLPSQEVKLTVVPALLGPPTWASVPSLLCHELVAHITQAAPMESVDSFAEGWMDLVAWQYHEAWIGELFPQWSLFATSSANQLRELTSMRHSGLGEVPQETRAVRVTGTDAAERVNKLVTALVRESGLPPNSDFWRLSLQLCRLSTTPKERSTFVSAVLDAMAGPDLRVTRRWSDCVDGWIHDQISASEVLLFR